MKTVFDNYEIFHIYAQQTQSIGRNSNRTIFFENEKIYSYGYHYLLGEFITNNKGENAIIINDKGYSNTTAKHISRLYGATSHYLQFNLTQTKKDIVLKKIEELQLKAAKARKPHIYISQALYLFNKYRNFCEWKGEKIDKQIKKAFSFFEGENVLKSIEKKKAEILKDKKRAEAKAQKEQKERLKKFKEDLKKFNDYEINYLYQNELNEEFLRISKDKQNVETTKGVKVSIEEAKKLYSLIKLGRDIKGHKIGDFTVISLNGVLTIGCHRINRVNMEEIGEKIIK